jgi:hypothetical protein
VSAARFPFRFVEIRGVRYLRIDDVAAFVRELGSAEETDVRKRLDEAARQITCAGGSG